MRNIIQVIYIFLLISSFGRAELNDTLNYYEKFNQAIQYYQDGRFRLAENEFNLIYINERNYEDPAAQLLVAKCQNQQKLWDKAKSTCKAVLINYPDSPYEVDIHVLLGDIALAQGKTTQALQNYLNARPQIDDLLYINDIDDRIYRCIGIGLNEERLEGLLFREKNKFNRAIINLARAYQNWIRGDKYDMESIINGIDTFYLPGRFSGLYGYMKNIPKSHVRNPVTIAVTIPLTGIKKNKGYSYLLGLSEYLDLTNNPESIRFLVYDTQGSGINILKIMKHLTLNKQITAVLGPLTNEEIFGLSGLNPKLPLLIPTPSKPGLSDLADNLFFLSPSLKTIAERTAQMIIKELGFRSIAVLAPVDGDAKLSTDYFLNECYQLGVDPIAIEWYVEKPINLSRQLKSIRRKAWELMPKEESIEDSHNLEIDSLDALFDVDVLDFFELPKEKEEQMNKNDSAKIILETIQALYIPIRPDELTYIGTQLPFYNFNTLLFGNQNWLNMELLNQEVIGPHIQGMRVISDVSSALSINSNDSFLNFYNIAIEHAFFIQSIAKKGIYKRQQFKQELKNIKGYYGKRTSIKFTGNKKNENGYTQVLEYSKNNLKTLGIYDGETFSHSSE